ncbi:MAG: Ig-like domain-containing protein [Limisphaerales bacterium]
MKLKKISYAVSVSLALCLIHSVSAQDDHWNGTVTNTLWNNPNNWLFNGITNEVPPFGNSTNTFTGNVWLDPSPVDGDTLITIPAGDVETPGVGNSVEVYNTMFGPEFGCTLDIYGTLGFDWTIAPYQPDPTPGLRSHINMYGNAYMYTTGASLNLGSGWWAVCEGPYVTMNLYDNANYSSLGGAGLWSGGHINIYDSATFLANGYVNFDNGQANNDGTTDFVLGGGTLLLPNGFSTTVTNWIQRGILRAYGKGYDTNDLIINDNVVFGTNTFTNTVVTAVPLGGSLQRVYFQALNRPNVQVGTFQQATLVGDYPSVSGVLLSSSEPGLDPATFAQPAYASSNPNVATIDTNGLVTAISPGSATLTATVGAFTSTNSISITVTPVTATLIHRYSFGTDASDSVGGANGALNGDATVSGGQLVLDGTQGSSVTLPAGIVSGLDEVTIESWVTFPSTNTANAYLFAFGTSDLTPLDPNEGAGGNYISFSPDAGGLTAQANFGQGVPGNLGERDAVINGVLENETNIQVVAVYHPLAGYEAVYTNGVLGATISMFNNLIDPVANAGPTYTNINTGIPGASILAYTLGADTNNYIGQSLYTADPGLLANIDEFRIYNGALTASQIAADYALGPNQLIGTSTNVKLTASMSGGNLVITWPTTSALVTLQSSPALGAGASWTTVGETLAVAGSNYQVTMPVSGSASAQFFRLTK